MLTCPYCSDRATTRLRKLALKAGGPSQSINCRSCGRRVGVSQWSHIALLPLVLSFSTLGRVPLPWFSALMAAGALFYILARAFIVPLVRRHT